MLYIAIIIIYATSFATIVSEVARHDLGWGPLATTFTWLAGIAVSLVPILRTIILAAALSMLIPWWGAIPAACGINVLRHLLLIIFNPGRRANLEDQKQRLKDYAEKQTDRTLSPEVQQELSSWNAEYDRAIADGRGRESKVSRAKALVVVATNSPILMMVSGSSPLICQPGYIESLTEDKLDDLIESLSEISTK